MKMLKPSMSEVNQYVASGKYTVLPISMELLSDFTTPVEVMRILKNVSNHCYMLESVAANEQWGRYTFLGYAPKIEITCTNGHMKIGDMRVETNDPGEHIRQLLSAYKSPVIPGMPPFTGGLVGYFSYNYIKYTEPTLNLDADDTEGFNDVDLMLFDKVIAFDNFRQKIILTVNIRLDNAEIEYNRAKLELRQMAELLRKGQSRKDLGGRLKSEVTPCFTLEEYSQIVEKAKHYIREGDIFQVVPSNRLEAEFEGSLFDTYRTLRTVNPSPYMFYFAGENIEVAGASPETLVKLEQGVLHTFPIAGSRPRGATPDEDAAFEKELLADPKERAEHNMLVDLGRNDLGRISKFGSIGVEEYMSILRFSHVMHIGSSVRGELKEGLDAIDAIAAVLPAGTLSGAPKIRACEIINELEQNKRGIYGGAIGYIDFSGNMDTCIAIRIAYKVNNKVYVRSGGGIVADSEPETEYQETINKAAAVVKALKLAQEEIL
ncbi:MAG TPA: anthranilate synthase component I [Clostridiales bacterium]|nr:anthranilate synthase component I [Clostridiales bacterium]